MKSNFTFSKTKSIVDILSPKSVFIQKIKTIFIWIFCVMMLLFCLAFNSPVEENSLPAKQAGNTNTFSYEENVGWSFSVGPTDTIDLALVLTTTDIFACPGSQISFKIDIFNQRNVVVENYEITDYIPAGLTLSTTNNVGWVQTGSKAKKTISTPIAGMGMASDTIYFDVDSTFTGLTIENRAEISGADCDTDPNNAAPFEIDSNLDDLDDDVVGGDNIIDNSFGDEDDHDYAFVFNDAPTLTTISPTPSVCNFDNGSISVSPMGFVSYDWSDGGSGAVRTGLFAGLYTVTVTKSTGCTSVVDSIEVTNDCTGCVATAGTVTLPADTFCLQGDTLWVNFTDDGNSVEPQPQFITSYFLTKGNDKAIMAVDTTPQFPITEVGNYNIHVKVFDVLHVPQEEVDSVVIGVTPITFLDEFLQSGGGYLCGAIDLVGVPFVVGSAYTTVDSIADESCNMADGYILLSNDTLNYAWSDGGSGHERNDLAPGTYSVTITGSANCVDSIQNLVIGSDCILNDTVSFVIEVDSVLTICGDGAPNYFSNITNTTLCSGAFFGSDGTYGTYNSSDGGCLTYFANDVPGANIDTICVVEIDDNGNQDTTIFIPTIICHTVPQIMNVPCNLDSLAGALCLDIPFDSIGLYDVVVGGIPMQNGFTGCNGDSSLVYDYSLLFGVGNLPPYNLDSWTVGAQTFSATFQSMQELVDSMNVWDATNNWILDAMSFTISGGDPTAVYSDLIITHPTTSSTTNFAATVNADYAGTQLMINEGTTQVVYTRSGELCPTAVLEITVACVVCNDVLPADTVQVMASHCDSLAEFCVGVAAADIFDYNIMVDGMMYGGALTSCDFAGVNDGTTLELEVGLHQVIFTEITTGCSDTLMVNIDCIPCGDWLPDNMMLTTTECHLDVETCLNIPTANLSDFEIRDNGALYGGTISTCINGTDATIAVDTGFHQITLMNVVTGCSDTMNLTVSCLPDTIVIDTIIEVTTIDTFCLDEINVGDISMIDISCGDTVDVTINYTFDTLTNCIIFEGTMIGTDTLCFRLFDNFGNRTDVFFRIIVTPPCGNGFLDTEMVTLGLGDCSGTTPLCIEIPFNEIGDYMIMDNGVAYANTLSGCDFDTSYSINYFALPDQGTSGPYNLDAWMIGDSTYSGQFMTIADLVDSMNVWDTTSVWTIDTTNFLIEGGSTALTYGNMTVTQIASSAFALLDVNESLFPNGTTLMLGQGNHELIFFDSSFCTDTIQVEVLCLTPEVVMDTVAIGATNTYCVDTMELIGNVVSISNTCPGQSGTFASFEIVDSSFCVNYTGLAPGDNSACIIVCDDLGLCDTTNIFVHVLVDSLAMPVAVDDNGTTLINDTLVMNISGNDSINGIFDTLYVLTPPSNGTVSVNGDYTVVYEPNLDYCDDNIPDTFTYVFCNTVGCDTATVTVLVNCEVPSESLVFYNGFSPNGDNVNDVFMIRGAEAFPGNVLCVFNRWGNRVYYKEGYDNTFDGTWEGLWLPDGTYFYVFDDGAGNKYSGYVQISR